MLRGRSRPAARTASPARAPDDPSNRLILWPAAGALGIARGSRLTVQSIARPRVSSGIRSNVALAAKPPPRGRRAIASWRNGAGEIGEKYCAKACHRALCAVGQA